MSIVCSLYAIPPAYYLRCVDTLVVGDQIAFERPLFSGGFWSTRVTGFQTVTGVVKRVSYGIARREATYSIECSDGKVIRATGRTLFAYDVYRKEWADENLRKRIANGARARIAYLQPAFCPRGAGVGGGLRRAF